jgi:large subunit ribosomal protein L25
MKKENPKLKASVRTITGKKVKNLRKQGLLPSTIYGQGMEPISIQVVDKDLEAIFKHAGESGLVDLTVDDKVMPILFRNPQYHPVVGNLLHVDCFKVNLKEKITTNVPIVFIGEAPAVKEGKVLVEVLNEVEIEALPADFPEKIEVDLTKLENVDSVITVADLVIDKKLLEIKNEPGQVIVKVEEPKVEEEPVVAEEVVAPGDVPATEQKTPEEIAADEAKAAEEKKKEEKKERKE